MVAELKRVPFGTRGIPHAALVNTCPECGETHESRPFTLKKWDAWLRAHPLGARVQSFWRAWSPAEREEFFVSGVCDACWRKLFPPEDEDGEAAE